MALTASPLRHIQDASCNPHHLPASHAPALIRRSHSDVSLQAKPSKDGASAKSPKPARRQANAAATHAAAAPPQTMPWSPDPGQKLPPWETFKPPSPHTAAPPSSAATAPQPGLTPEEDRISLAALAAGVTPAKAPRVGCSYTVS